MARDVRAILGNNTKIGYAADWREYWGFVPVNASDDLYFPLYALWAEPVIDFVGINARFPLADWRDETAHLDRHWQSIENPKYLMQNMQGGEGYEWYYPTQEDRER